MRERSESTRRPGAGRAAGIDPRDVRTHRIWDAEAVVDAMMEHIASGRSLRATEAREEDPALYHAAHRHCGGFSHAVALARAKIGDGEKKEKV